MPDKIRTRHPDGKTGVNISQMKYDLIKSAILASIDERGEIRFQDLSGAVEDHLKEPFEGSIGWYTTTVKLDLEARRVIERIPGQSPQVLRRVDNR